MDKRGLELLKRSKELVALLDRDLIQTKCPAQHPTAIRALSRLALMNLIVEQTFYRLLWNLVLKRLPGLLLNFPRQEVVGVNIDKLLVNTLSEDGACSKALVEAVIQGKSFLDLVRRHGIALK